MPAALPRPDPGGLVAASLASQRFSATLLGVFAALALVLASLGVYGVISYAVAQRSRELGLRMALGAQRDGVLRLVVRQGMGLVLLGVAVGLVGAFAASRLLRSLLYEIDAATPDLRRRCPSSSPWSAWWRP